MKLSEIFLAQNIVDDLAASEKRDALKRLVQQLCDSGTLAADEGKDVVKSLMRREELGSTGIGKGVAVPHAKHSGVTGTTGALGRAVDGVAFDALDGQPVHLVFMLISSPDAVEPHLEALKKITTLLHDEEFCLFMRRAKDAAELAELLDEAEERLAE